jgi:non-specific serine/threonine protein kinase
MTVAQALGLTPVPGLAITSQVIAALQPRETLLVLDNCEHVLEQTAELAISLLQVCPGLQLVATSRAPLRLRYERDFPVEPLPLPGVHAAVDALLQNDAVCLFAERAEAVDQRFALDAGNVREVAAICRALDGLPLAIELAAARTRVLSLGVLQHQMSDRLGLLRGGARDLPTRQRTIAGTIAWSYTLLTPTQQASFRRLGVFAGGWSLPAAVAVAADPGGAAHILDDLTALVDQSLVRRDYDSANLRFTMLETIREFALRELTSQGEDVATRARHAAWYLEMVERLNLHHAPQGDSARTRELMPEQDNLRQALAWYEETRATPALTRLSAALARFWFDLGQFSEARHWLQVAIADDAVVEVLSRARAWNKAAWLAMCQGDLEQAAALRATGLELAREAGDAYLLAESVFEAGILAFWLGDLPHAAALIEESQRTLAGIEAEYATAPIKMCSTLNLLGGIALITGDVALAAERGEAAVEMARALAANSDLGYALCGLGYARLQQGDHEAAAACFLESLAIAWGNQDLAFLARLLWAFAAIALHQQQPEFAAQLIGAADALDARTGSAMWPNDRVLADWCEERLGTELATHTCAQLRAQGAALPAEQPVVLATQLAAGVLGQKLATDAWARGNGPDFEASAHSPLVGGRSRVAWPTFQGSQPATGTGRLTEREHMVLLHLIDGCTDREIAARLFISRRTVSKHLEAIFAKLGVHNRGAAVAEAQRLDLSARAFRDDTESPISAD